MIVAYKSLFALLVWNDRVERGSRKFLYGNDVETCFVMCVQWLLRI